MAATRAELVGNLVKDAQLKSAGSTYVMELSVAVNEYSGGEKQPSYYDCIMWDGKNGRAQKLVNYLPKGAKVAIFGHLKQERWQTREGQNRSRVVIVIDEIEFMDKRQQQPEAPLMDVYEDEVPF